MKVKYQSLAFLLVLAAFFFSPLLLKAEEPTGVKIQPSIIEELVDPGQVFSSVLRITNLASETKTFYIVKRNISGISEQGTPIVAEEQEKTGYEVSSWIKITQDPVTVSSQETREVPFTIEVPREASPGGHFGVLFVSSVPPRLKETGVGVGFQVGTLIHLRLAGEVFEEAQIREFRVNKTMYSKPEVQFMTRVENLGNTLVRPRGPIEITDFFGRKTALIRMNDEGAGVFPKTIHAFETTWEGEQFAFGRHQAVMSLVYGEEEKKTISGSLSFWVLPLNTILWIIGVILGVILAITIFTRLYIGKKLQQIGERTAGIGKSQRRIAGTRNASSFSKLARIALALLLFTLIFLLALFFFFA